MKILYLAALAGAALFSTAPEPVLAGIAGRWTQTSNAKELVLMPRVKLVPNVGVTAGTNLGGTVGYGSMTRTTIVTEPVPMTVARSMTLTVERDGQFDWTITRRHAEKDGCTITTTQQKRGRVASAQAKLTFMIAGGTEKYVTSCGRSGQTQLGASTETYALQMAAGGIVLTSGPSRWTFRR